MSGENWESLITEKGFMRVPRALRLKRAELGITNNEYTILLDYVDYYSFSGTMNPYRHLTEVSGMSERGIKKVLASLEHKGLLKRKLSRHGNGRTNGVVFSIDPLVRKLRSIMKKSSPTVGEEMDTHVYEESFTPNTGEEFNKREDDKNTSAKNTDVRARARGDDLSVEEDMSLGETTEGRNKSQISHTLWFASPARDSEDTSSQFAEGVRFLHPFRTVVRNDYNVGTAVDGVCDVEGMGEAGDTSYGFIRGTGGPHQEAPRNDRRAACECDAATEGGKASQIHLARAGDGPHGLVSGEGSEIIEHGEFREGSSPSQDLTPAGSALPTNSKGTGCTPPPAPFSNMPQPSAVLINSPASSEETTDPSLARNRPIKGEGTENIKTRLQEDRCPGQARSRKALPRKDRRWGGEYTSSRWYNEVWRGLYEEAAGQPALTGMREYRAAETYFARLRELNPEMEPGEVYELAGECAAFMIASQLEGGVFGWMHKPPDICLLASQAQSVEWHLRKMRRVISQSGPSLLRQSSGQAGFRLRQDFAGSPYGSKPSDDVPQAGRADTASPADSGGRETKKSYMSAESALRERLREGRHANEQIERVYGELRGIERAASVGSFENECGRGSGRALRQFDPSTIRQSTGRTVERRALRRGRG